MQLINCLLAAYSVHLSELFTEFLLIVRNRENCQVPINSDFDRISIPLL